jgi:hypothetical protein
VVATRPGQTGPAARDAARLGVICAPTAHHAPKFGVFVPAASGGQRNTGSLAVVMLNVHFVVCELVPGPLVGEATRSGLMLGAGGAA